MTEVEKSGSICLGKLYISGLFIHVDSHFCLSMNLRYLTRTPTPAEFLWTWIRSIRSYRGKQRTGGRTQLKGNEINGGMEGGMIKNILYKHSRDLIELQWLGLSLCLC